MTQSHRVFQKIVDQIIGMRLSCEYRGMCGQYQNEWFYVPNVICRPNQGETFILTIELTARPADPNGMPVRDLQPLLEGAIEVSHQADTARTKAA